jgi:hypothetical protein
VNRDQYFGASSRLFCSTIFIKVSGCVGDFHGNPTVRVSVGVSIREVL